MTSPVPDAPEPPSPAPAPSPAPTREDTAGTVACWGGALACAVILGALGVYRLQGDGGALPPYLDTDTYSRLVRVRDLWFGGGWYTSAFERIVPDGLVSHWTRPLDVLVIVCALPLMAFMDPLVALHWGGYLVSPVLCLVAATILACALRPLLNPHQVVFTALALVFVYPLLSVFLPGRPDHYPPLIVVAALIVMGLVLTFTRPGRRAGPLLLGAALPLAIWVNISGVLLALAVPVILGLRWLVSGAPWAGRNRAMALAATLACLVALTLERPPAEAFFTVEFDRLSIAHVAVFATILAFWSAVVAIESRRPSWSAGPIRRLPWTAGLAAVGVGVLLGLFPQLLTPDRGIPIDPLYAATRLVRISEYQPLIEPENLTSLGALLRRLAHEGLHSLPLVLSALGLLALLARPHSAPGARWVWGSLLALALIYLAATWPPVPAWMTIILALLVPGYGALAGWAFAALSGLRLAVRVPARVGVTCLIMLAPVAVQTLARPEASQRTSVLELCHFTALSRHLDRELPDTPRQNIMTMADMGAELMYRTPHAVYAIPNHRLQPGFTMTWRVMTADSAHQARRHLAQARADILIICEAEGLNLFRDDDPARDFRTRVLNGEVPAWLTPLPLPEPLNDTLRVYRVEPADQAPASRSPETPPAPE